MFEIDRVYERDIDLYIVNKLMNDNNFVNLFLSKLSLSDYKVNKCIHSGDSKDSEIIVILEKDNDKVGLLIENNINTNSMASKYNSYFNRGDKLVKDGMFSKFCVFLTAPRKYLSDDNNNYYYKLSYEEILDSVSNDEFGKELFVKAISEKVESETKVETKTDSDFIDKYYAFIEQFYPMLDVNRMEKVDGSEKNCPIFNIPVSNLIKIYHKANNGQVDMIFPNTADKYMEIYNMSKPFMKENMKLHAIGKITALRIIVPVVDFNKNFDEQLDGIKKSLDAVVELQKFMKFIDYNKIVSYIQR